MPRLCSPFEKLARDGRARKADQSRAVQIRAAGETMPRLAPPFLRPRATHTSFFWPLCLQEERKAQAWRKKEQRFLQKKAFAHFDPT
eukprot:495862-Prymnesium_polylepis.1